MEMQHNSNAITLRQRLHGQQHPIMRPVCPDELRFDIVYLSVPFELRDEAVERYALARRGSLLAARGARVVDQDVAHRARGEGEEVGAVVPLRAGLAQVQVELADDIGGVRWILLRPVPILLWGRLF